MQAGDVIFIRSKGLKSLLNRIGQTIASGKLATRSHVMLCIAPDVVIDATPEHGVSVRNVIREVISGHLTAEMCEQKIIQVYRPPPERWDSTTGDALVDAMTHIGKKYNFKIGFPNPSDDDPETQRAKAAYCSELVVLMLNKLLDPHTASRTLPISLEKIVTKDGWPLVTDEWKADLKQIADWAESEDKQECGYLGARLWQGNQQMHLILTLKQSEIALKQWNDQLAAIWRNAGKKPAV